MAKPKKILFVFFSNFLKDDMGCSSVALLQARALRVAGFSIDLAATASVFNNFSDFDELNRKEGLIDNLYLYDPLKSGRTTEWKVRGISVFRYENSPLTLRIFLFGRRIFSRRKRQRHGWLYQYWADDGFLKVFQGAVSKNHYDYIFLHYIQLADLVKYTKIPAGTKKVFYMHDSLFSHFYYMHGDMDRTARMFANEIKLLQLFDRIACISNDERVFFQKFLPGKELAFLPPLMDAKEHSGVPKDIDVLFLGSDNPFNRDGVIWFAKSVMPHLPATAKVCIAGQVGKSLREHNPAFAKSMAKLGIEDLGFVEDLDRIFSRAKVSVCPIRQGTGIKIKVVDSMARGIPIVCTSLGVDGFPDKTENGCLVADDPREFAALVVRLLSDREFYAATQRREREYFARRLGREANLETLLGLFDERARPYAANGKP